jgi:hypothetical protein
LDTGLYYNLKNKSRSYIIEALISAASASYSLICEFLQGTSLTSFFWLTPLQLVQYFTDNPSPLANSSKKSYPSFIQMTQTTNIGQEVMLQMFRQSSAPSYYPPLEILHQSLVFLT